MSVETRPELSSMILSPTPWPSFDHHFDPYMLVTVKEPSIKVAEKTIEIDGSDVEFYPVTIQTNYEKLPSHSVVKRRYSEFQQFHQLLIDKGLHPPSLRRTRHIPTFKNKSRREELQDLLDYVAESGRSDEIRSFIQAQENDYVYKTRSSILSVVPSPKRLISCIF